MSSMQTFGFGQGDKKVLSKKNKFKMETGETTRISFAWWKGLEDGNPDFTSGTPIFTHKKMNYIQGVGYIENQGAAYTELAGEAPKTKIATLIVKWPLKPDMSLDIDAVVAGKAQVLPWIFSGDKYSELATQHTMWNFGKHDLIVKCSEAKYQKMTFTACPDSFLNTADQPDTPLVQKLRSAYPEILVEGKAYLSQIGDLIARKMTLDQIREKMGMSNPSPTAQNSMSKSSVSKMMNSMLDN